MCLLLLLTDTYYQAPMGVAMRTVKTLQEPGCHVGSQTHPQHPKPLVPGTLWKTNHPDQPQLPLISPWPLWIPEIRCSSPCNRLLFFYAMCSCVTVGASSEMQKGGWHQPQLEPPQRTPPLCVSPQPFLRPDLHVFLTRGCIFTIRLLRSMQATCHSATSRVFGPGRSPPSLPPCYHRA